MLHWRAHYYLGNGRTREFYGPPRPFVSLPVSGVLSLTLTDPSGHFLRLIGGDAYYLLEDEPPRFGLLNEDSEDEHWQWSPETGFVRVPEPPATIPHRVEGVLIPDDEARRLGLIT